MTKKQQRKKVIVDKVHLKFVLITVCYCIVVVIVSSLVAFLPGILEMSSGGEGRQVYEAANEIILLHRRFWPAILVAIAIVSVHSMFLFHRVFGPLYRFRYVFGQITKGNLGVNASIRKNDFLRLEETAIKDMVKVLKEQVSSLQSVEHELAEVVSNIVVNGKSKDGSLEVSLADAERIKTVSDKLGCNLRFFKLDS